MRFNLFMICTERHVFFSSFLVFFIFYFLYSQKSKIKILTHGQIRTLNQTIQNNRYQPRTPQGTM